MLEIACGPWGEHRMFFASMRNLLSQHDGKLRSLCRIGFAACILIVCVLSLLPGDDLPDVAFSDKVHHLVAYCAIALSGLLGYRGLRASIWVIAGSIALGGALEIGQMFVPGRSPDILDFLVNIVGVVTGLIAARLVMRLWHHQPPPGMPQQVI